jgi:hypothetical protein
VAFADSVPPAGSIATWTVNATLVDETIYYWRIRAFDGYEYGAWSNGAPFWVNSVNNAPTAFNLIAPADNAILSPNQVFRWGKSTDSDRFDSVKYNLYYSMDSTFATKDSIAGILDTQYTFTASIALGRYFWKVVAHDLFGGQTSSPVYHFTTGVAGDANSDGNVNVGDPVFLIKYIFQAGPAPLSGKTADPNNDCFINVGDIVYLINYIFKSGPAPVMGCA